MNFVLLAGDKVPFNYKGCNMHEAIATVQKSMVFAAMCETRGNKLKAAKILGINRNTLHKIFQQFPETRQRDTRKVQVNK